MENFFTQFGIDEDIIKALTEKGLVTPTPVQEQVIPLALTGVDIVAQAPTGTGKTLGFVLPILAKIDRNCNDVQAIVLCPTRELVIQTCDVLASVTKYYESLRVTGVYGGQNIQRQLMSLKRKPQFIIGTPGRVIDHLSRHTLKLEHVKMFVLDEGDEMFDMGFRDDIEKIMSKAPDNCQKMVFSATIPKEIKKLVDSKLTAPTYLKVTQNGEDLPKITQKYCVLKDSQRMGAMLQLIDDNHYKLSIVFCNTKMRVDKLAEGLQGKGRSAEALHGDLRQSQRTTIMRRFKTGELEILVATDVAARGIDVNGVQAIFNFDPPSDEDSYVHRIGRTARANKDGAAYTFVSAEQVGAIPGFQKVSHNALEFLDMPNIEMAYTMPRDFSNRMRGVKSCNTTRFFINVGQRDMLDDDAVLKLVTTKTKIEHYQITDIKLRDNYGFVEVMKGCEEQFLQLAGMQIGNRTLNIEKADEKDVPRRKRTSMETREYRPRRTFSEDIAQEKRAEKKAQDEKAKAEAIANGTYVEKPVVNEDEENERPARRTYGDRPQRSSSDRPARSYGDRPQRSFGDRPARPYGDRPARSYGDKPAEGSTAEGGERPARTYGDRPARTYGDRPQRSFGDRPARSFGDRPARPYGDRPARSYGDKPAEGSTAEGGERPARTYGDRPARTYGDRPQRSFGDRPARSFGDRPARPYGDRPARPYGDRPARSYGDKPAEGSTAEGGERPARTYGDRPARTYGDRPQRSFGDRPARSFGDRPARPYGDRPARPYGDRPARSYGDKPAEGSTAEGGERPARTYGDRPARTYGDRPQRTYGDRPQRSFGDRPARPYGDRPARPYGDRPARSYGDKPAEGSTTEGGERPARTYGDRPARTYGDRPQRSYGDRPARSYGDRPARAYGDKPTGEGSDRPRTYGDSRPRTASSSERPRRSFGDKPSFGGGSGRPSGGGFGGRPSYGGGGGGKPRGSFRGAKRV